MQLKPHKILLELLSVFSSIYVPIRNPFNAHSIGFSNHSSLQCYVPPTSNLTISISFVISINITAIIAIDFFLLLLLQLA